ncbi:MAG: TRAP transporter small permease subunit, partial [Shewanella sp.]|nr:TRAP transporter small permease subunit [Shewanella sp.]
MHGAVFTLAAGYTLKHDAHVRVDILYRRFSPGARHWVDLLDTLYAIAGQFVYCLGSVDLSWLNFARSRRALIATQGVPPRGLSKYLATKSKARITA